MPELRQDPTTKEWVIMATERARRPDNFAQERLAKEPLPPYDPNCPFCPGHEDRTPPTVLEYAPRQEDGNSAWGVRVVPNLYPALALKGSLERRQSRGFFRHMDGVGVHEVIIETPQHNKPMALMSREEVNRVLQAYQDRYNALKGEQTLRFITIFKNYGEGAGTSLVHPHSQLVATPVAPLGIRRKYEVAISYYDDWGRCLYCDYFQRELESGERVVSQTANLMAFHPYASPSPFETWIVPKEHRSSFGFLSRSELEELASILKAALWQIYHMLHDPDFNLILDTAPTEQENAPYYDWHIHIIPRLITAAGFEMGTGMCINTALPEQTAEYMRQTAPEAWDEV